VCCQGSIAKRYYLRSLFDKRDVFEKREPRMVPEETSRSVDAGFAADLFALVAEETAVAVAAERGVPLAAARDLVQTHLASLCAI
jgi:hypothetical protein